MYVAVSVCKYVESRSRQSSPTCLRAGRTRGWCGPRCRPSPAPAPASPSTAPPPTPPPRGWGGASWCWACRGARWPCACTTGSWCGAACRTAGAYTYIHYSHTAHSVWPLQVRAADILLGRQYYSGFPIPMICMRISIKYLTNI